MNVDCVGGTEMLLAVFAVSKQKVFGIGSQLYLPVQLLEEGMLD